MLKWRCMKRRAAIIIFVCVCMGFGGCTAYSPAPQLPLPQSAALTPQAMHTIVPGTFMPAPTAEPSPAADASPSAPTEAPTDVPSFEGAYKSPLYPLTPKSQRTVSGGMYPEEPRLNNDPDKFKCIVDLTNQCVFVYERDGSGAYTVLVREMTASCGTKQNPTPVGTFNMQNDYKRFGYFVRFYCYAQYWSQVVGKIYFHSIPYLERDSRYLDVEGFYMLGSPASHGCIRLLPDDAQWVYLYLCPGTVVQITDKFPRDEALRARLNLITLPTPDGYEIAGN